MSEIRDLRNGDRVWVESNGLEMKGWVYSSTENGVTTWPDTNSQPPMVAGKVVYPVKPHEINAGDWVYANSGLGLSSGVASAIQDHITRKDVLILPIVKPGIVAGSILVFVPSLGAYVTPRVLGGGKQMMIGNFIELQFGQGRNWPLGAALSMALLLIVTAALLFYVRAANKGGHGHG